MNIRLRASASSDVGRHRRTNEDSFGFDMDRSLFVVCDGVGGAQAGELASRSAVDCVLSLFPAEICEGNAVAPALHVEGLNPHGNAARPRASLCLTVSLACSFIRVSTNAATCTGSTWARSRMPRAVQNAEICFTASM